ncbi:MAG: hypothetical protein EOO65_04515 [Methanosarcinales archaeon]|nr:MAG: hypothetical protein EOO65_04515 [Methanosarcinales archaeon]
MEAVKAVYNHKTKSLLSSISALEAEVARLKAANKEHKRSAYIAALTEVCVRGVQHAACSGSADRRAHLRTHKQHPCDACSTSMSVRQSLSC